MYIFVNYGGKYSAGAERYGPKESVLRLVEEIQKNQNYQFFFDNWFLALPLVIKLQSMGILSTATLRSNRPAGWPFMSDKDLKATGRGSFDYHIDLNSSLRVVKWYYNKGVILGSSLFLFEASSTKRRWDFVKKNHCNVTYPEIVKEYNEIMGGMDLNDLLISLYPMDIQTRKRWYLKIITHCVNFFKFNGWLLHRRCREQLRVPEKN